MWDFLTTLLKDYGLVVLIPTIEVAIIAYLFKTNQDKTKELINLYDKRVVDITECKEEYAELARNLEKSIDLLVKVVRG